MALDIGAQPIGNWSGCHAVAWERNAPEFGDLAVGDQFQKHSYPWGIYINAEGKRFVDEGADFRNYTYAKYGRVILSQPGQFAWQIFDAKVKSQLRDEYRIKQVTKVTASTLDTPPFEAYAVTCGITFTFGGLRINTGAQVMSTDGEPIPGLYAAGELVGGIFYFNYPGGTGLTNGSVFGRIAGANAAKAARSESRSKRVAGT